MILRGIQLRDFGLYAGKCELDLVPRRRNGRTRPVIIIGGLNGAGKTTILEAVRLALYGRRALGSRVGQSEYEDYLRRRIHRNPAVQSAAVGVEFDYAEAGVVHSYAVRREWAVRGQTVVETLLVEKDGAAVDSVPREEWHQFLQELIPPGVSQLFFFDGERITEIANGGDDGQQLADAIRGLLGIELVSRLRTDLGLYLARHQRSDVQDSDAGPLEAVIRDLTTLERDTSALVGEVAELTSARDSQARSAEQIRRRFVSEGGDAAMQRDKLEFERQEVTRRIDAVHQEFRELANRLLPFTFAPRLVGAFRAELAKVAAQPANRDHQSLRSVLSAWKRTNAPKRSASWSKNHWSDLTKLAASLERTAPTMRETHSALKEVGDGALALARLNEADAIVRQRARSLHDELDALMSRSVALDVALERADNAASGYLLEELRLAEQRVGGTEALLHARKEVLHTAHGRRVTLERERQRLLEQQNDLDSSAHRTDLATRSACALAAYEQRLLNQKVGQLRAEFVRLFNFIARKVNLLADMKIDLETFATELLDPEGNSLPKSSLSAGEQQIYAISLLWALARTSGRPLPMIIDTPLARLDSEHRNNIIQRYFPSASHQVILLSTDTEIDEGLYERLSESVSHAYHLEFSGAEKRTRIVPGYFDGNREIRGRARAI